MDTPRFCIDCRHFQKATGQTISEEDTLYWAKCTKKHAEDPMYLVTGVRAGQHLTARAQRSEPELPNWCGPSGKWFEPKDPGNIIDKTINNLRES